MIAGIGLAVIAMLTLGPEASPAADALRRPWCLWCDAFALRDFLLNVLLFLPLGTGLGMMRVRVPIALMILITLTVGIEAAQLVLLEGRHANVRDVIANAIGGTIGLWIGWRWRLLVKPHPRRAWRFAGAARIAWVAIHLLTGWLLRPAGVDSAAGVIVGTHVGGYSDFGGRVLRWNLATGGRKQASDSAGVSITPAVAVVATAIIDAGPRSEAMTPFITAVDSAGAFPFMLALREDDVLLSVRTRADIARLRSPAFRYPDAVRPWYRMMRPPGNILRITATRTSAQASALVETASGTRFGGDIPIRTTQGWTLLWPGRVELAPGSRAGSALWCFVLLLPLGYWTAMTNRHRRMMGWSLAGVATGSGLIVGPLLFAQAYPAWLDVASAAAGLLAGALLSVVIKPSTRS